MFDISGVAWLPKAYCKEKSFLESSLDVVGGLGEEAVCN